MDPKRYVLTKGVVCGNPENSAGFCIPAGQLVTVVKRMAGEPDRVLFTAPAGFSELGLVSGVEGACHVDDLGPAPPAWS